MTLCMNIKKEVMEVKGCKNNYHKGGGNLHNGGK